jgi:uncharacterized cupredoxin-like copper-binding protein
MRRLALPALGLLCAVAAVSYALAQGVGSGTPTPVVCATPAAQASPVAGELTPIPLGTPAGCNIVNDAPTIELYDLGFAPNALTIPADRPVTITLRNTGVALHNFTVDGLDISQNVLPGETLTVTLTAPAGDYPFSCDIPGHRNAGMVGLLMARRS